MKMKTKLLAAFAMAGGLFVTSCGDMDQHQLMIVYPAQGYSVLYADESADSISFVTFDSWRVRPNEPDWIRLTGEETGNIKYDNTKRYWITCELEFAPNTSNKTRLGTVEVFSYEYSVGAKYLQYGHLDISHPEAEVENFREGSTIPETVKFCLTDSAFVPSDSLCFNVHQRWNLAYKDGQAPSWLKISEMEGTPGKNTLELTFEENLSTEPRSTVLLLTSGRVTNEIKIEQLGRKKKENE